MSGVLGEVRYGYRMFKGRFVLSITATAGAGRRVTGTRTYHTCVPKSKRHYARGKL